MRGILEEYYGVPHRQCTWVVERSEDVEFTPPKDLRIEMIAPGKRLDVMLAEGEIPAMLSPDIPRLFLEGDKRIVRLFPDYKDIEVEFFRKTGIFPIMHVTVIKQEIVDKYPWVATNLVKAFDEAKALAYRHIANPRVVPLAWIRTAWEEQQEVLGPDPWAYGLGDANRKNLETVLRYCHQQGLISRMMPLDDLFADTDLGDAGGGAENRIRRRARIRGRTRAVNKARRARNRGVTEARRNNKLDDGRVARPALGHQVAAYGKERVDRDFADRRAAFGQPNERLIGVLFNERVTVTKQNSACRK